MKRLTFEGNFCDIAQCFQLPTCDKDDYCSQRKVWERLKEYEDTGLEPEDYFIERHAAYFANVQKAERDGFFAHLKTRPTVDAVEVVRCKDCKHWHKETGWCDKHSHFVDTEGEACHPWESAEWKMLNEDDFCSHGERKDGEGNG